MKKVFVLLLVALLAGMYFGPMSATRVYAQGFDTQWTSSFQVQNLGTGDATVNVYYYNQDGTLATMANQQDGTPFPNPDSAVIVMGNSTVFFGTTLHVAPGFFGSVIIASNEPVAVVSNVFAQTAQQAVDSYVGLQQGGAALYFPLIMKGNNTQSTTFTVQNVGAASVSVVIHFEPEKNADGSNKYATVADLDASINQFGSATYDMTKLDGFSAIVKWVGSVKVTATGDGTPAIAGVANNVKVAVPEAYEMTSYNGFIGGNETASVTLPLIMENNSSNRTAVSCQNVGVEPTKITIAYTGESGSSYVKADEVKDNIAVNGSVVFIQVPDASQPKFVGSAIVSTSPATTGGTAAQPIFCVVTQQKAGTGRASAYPGLDAAKATVKVAFPAVQSKNGNASKGWIYTIPTLTALVAPTDADPWIKCDFATEPGGTNPASTLKQGKSVVLSTWQDAFGNGSKFVGGATCYTVTSDTDFTPTNYKLLATINQIRENPPVLPRDTQADRKSVV